MPRPEENNSTFSLLLLSNPRWAETKNSAQLMERVSGMLRNFDYGWVATPEYPAMALASLQLYADCVDATRGNGDSMNQSLARLQTDESYRQMYELGKSGGIKEFLPGQGYASLSPYICGLEQGPAELGTFAAYNLVGDVVTGKNIYRQGGAANFMNTLLRDMNQIQHPHTAEFLSAYLVDLQILQAEQQIEQQIRQLFLNSKQTEQPDSEVLNGILVSRTFSTQTMVDKVRVSKTHFGLAHSMGYIEGADLAVTPYLKNLFPSNPDLARKVLRAMYLFRADKKVMVIKNKAGISRRQRMMEQLLAGQIGKVGNEMIGLIEDYPDAVPGKVFGWFNLVED